MKVVQVLGLVAAFLQPQLLVSAAPQSVTGVTDLRASGHAQQVMSQLVPDQEFTPGDTDEFGDDEGEERFDGQQIWRFHLEHKSSQGKIEFMQRTLDLGLDIWKAASNYADLRLNADMVDLLKASGNDRVELLVADLQALVELSRPRRSSASASAVGSERPSDLGTFPVDTIQSPFHDAYHSLEEMYTFMDDLAEGFNGVEGLEVESFVVGKSAEGRDIKGVRARMAAQGNVTEGSIEDMAKKGKKQPKKPKKPTGPAILRELVLQSGQHAREWIGPATAIYYIHALIVAAKTEPTSEAARLLRSFTFTVVPTINPDGYAYSHEHSRMWRKNRQELGEKCQGIDLNSNWGYKWRSPHAPSPCSDAYPGKHSFEAVEAQVMANYLANGSSLTGEFMFSGGQPVERKVRSFVDLHSYGQLFMFPFAHSCDDFPPDAEMLMEAGLGVAKAMRSVHGEAYQSGQACDLTYRAPGDAIDYAYGVTDIRWAYSAELRDTGTSQYGFMLPPSLIRATAEETTAGLLYLGKFIYNLEIAG